MIGTNELNAEPIHEGGITRRNVEPQKLAHYRLPCAQMPPALRTDVMELLTLMSNQNNHARRSSRLNQRVEEYKGTLEQFAGYLINIRDHREITSLKAMLTEANVRTYVYWLSATRGCSRASIVGRFSRLFALLRVHPNLKEMDFHWVRAVLNELEKDNLSELVNRRRKKEAPYQALAAVSRKMQDEATTTTDISELERAWSFHDALLMKWLVVAPWPPECIRECYVHGTLQNLFYKPAAGEYDAAEIPPWATTIIKVARNADFWQYDYAPEHHPVRERTSGFVSQQVFPMLSEYVNKYRPVLMDGQKNDPGTLFLNRQGGSLTSGQLNQLVGDLTLRYIGKRVTPTAARASVAYAYLQDNPGLDGKIKLSRILWMELESVMRRF